MLAEIISAYNLPVTLNLCKGSSNNKPTFMYPFIGQYNKLFDAYINMDYPNDYQKAKQCSDFYSLVERFFYDKNVGLTIYKEIDNKFVVVRANNINLQINILDTGYSFEKL
jgi:hypothetical protein